MDLTRTPGGRTTAVVAALSLATDLAMGLPLEHGLRSTLIAVRVCDRLDVNWDGVADLLPLSPAHYLAPCEQPAVLRAHRVAAPLPVGGRRAPGHARLIARTLAGCLLLEQVAETSAVGLDVRHHRSLHHLPKESAKPS